MNARNRAGSLVAAVCTAMVLGASAAPAEELRIAIGAPGDNALVRGMQMFADKLEERTKGAYTGKVFAGSLLSYAEATNGVRDGIADVGYVIPAYTRAEFPNSNLVVDMATASTDPVVMAAASTEFMFSCKPCIDEFKKQNQVFMGYAVIGPYYLMSVDKVSSKADFAGKKFRGFGPFGRWVDQMGATSVLVGSNDIFESMSQGQLDGNTHTLDVLKSLSLGELADYVLNAPIGLYIGNAMFNTNRDVWNDLSADQKREFLMAAGESFAWVTVTYFAENKTYLEDPSKGGVELVEPDAELAAASQAFRDNDLGTVAELNRTKYEIADAEAQVDRMKGLVAKWTEIMAGIDETDTAAVAEVYNREIFGAVDPGSL